ncbi:MAG: pyruvate:ferredoxin (flavodoxin) oxidoreductase [Clostridium sp.]|nr:pyruvate:ferredoxin (flavodoxin) oxidoreductase [Clostridium sp.]
MKKIIDGCTATTYIAYALSEEATVYPITPIASMGETAQQWAAQGRKNVFGSTLNVVEMESELGAAGATHGALSGGALATTFTSSQGLMLMIPNMYKISGELLPGVFHVGCRSLATHALSIFGDHQDVMATRATGCAILVSNSVQEAMDLALVAHLSAISGSLPVVHMFDGWRTSNEMATVEMIDYADIAKLVDYGKVEEFRKRAMNPEHPQIRGTAQDSDVYFQNREAANPYYAAFPAIVEEQMRKVGELTGRNYSLFEYYGAADADSVIVTMGSSAEVVEQTVKYLNEKEGRKTGVVKVRLYRPLSAEKLVAAIPASVKQIAVLDRTKEPGAQGEPLYLDVVTALYTQGRADIKVIGGRYGLSSKDFSPAMAKAVFDCLDTSERGRQFTVGIEDDVTYLSLRVGEPLLISPDTMRQYMFYGIGSDGTVGATKQAVQIISELSGNYAQAYFEYSAKKSGGYTVSSVRVDKDPIKSEYKIDWADLVACNRSSYVKRFDLAAALKPGGALLLNSDWSVEDIDKEFPAKLKRAIAARGVKVYNVDAVKIAAANGLGVRINTIMEAAFLKLCGEVDYGQALQSLKDLIAKMYIYEGQAVVDKNLAAVTSAASAIVEIPVPAGWKDAQDAAEVEGEAVPDFIKKVARPCMRLEGDSLPVSAMHPDGFYPMGTTAYEKRAIALEVPQWNPAKCIQCTMCSFVCPHAAIRPVVLDEAEAKDAPATLATIPFKGVADGNYRYRIQVYSQDCVGCGSCAVICPGHALDMEPIATQTPVQVPALRYVQENIGLKPDLLPRFTVKGSQLRQPMLEFSGACAGCGETPYVKLLTQLFGERMVIANATGCSSIWGANFPSMAYCTDKNGCGPAWGNSLFEDNAEYGLGIALAIAHRRQHLADVLAEMAKDNPDSGLSKAIAEWLEGKEDAQKSSEAAVKLRPMLKGTAAESMADLLVKKSVWAIGGDGWAYDIGYAGLDHVIAQNVDINILVMDTQCYSNTGGQESKATPLGAIAKYAPQGKRTVQKSLGQMAIAYGYVYVAQISLGANPALAVKVLQEAEAYQGPSLVIAYCPCINHGIRAGMSHAIVEMRQAVQCGYWPTFHYNPHATPPLTVDSPTPQAGSLVNFINGESRYAYLKEKDPSAAATLQPELEKLSDQRIAELKNEQ